MKLYPATGTSRGALLSRLLPGRARFGTWAVCLLLTGPLFAQTPLSLQGLAVPVIPGERSLSFSLTPATVPAAQTEVWVFYASSAAELDDLSAASFQPASTRHFGKAVLLQKGSSLEARFVFPHRFHPQTPNADLFASLQGQPGLITVGFPAPQILAGIPLPGASGGTRIDFNPLVFEKGSCVYFRVVRRTRTASGLIDDYAETLNFRMPDSFNIGIAGDSYSAGEGAPADEYEAIGNNGDMWLSCKCHRSKKSGMLRGLKKFMALHPDLAVDYSFQACSGAETSELFRSQQLTTSRTAPAALYSTDCGGVNNAIQFEAIRQELIQLRKHEAVHMLLMSAGGNNTGFGDVVLQYLIEPLNLAALDAFGKPLHIDVLGEFKRKLEDLSADYAELDGGINRYFPERRPIIGITTYPDPTLGPDGRCGRTSLTAPLYLCASYENDYLLSPRDEYDLIYNRFFLPLNNQVKATASLGWNPIEVVSGNHGLCNCSAPYFNTLGASYAGQGDIYGIVHPNADGYAEVYRDKIWSFIENKYEEYRAAYSLGILLDVVPTAESCAARGLILGSSLIRLRQLSPVVASLKGFESAPADLAGASVQPVASRETLTLSLSGSTLAYKTAFNSLPLKPTVVQTPPGPVPVLPPRAPSTVLRGIRDSLKAYLASPDFAARIAPLRKQAEATRKPLAPDPLDALFSQ